MVMEYIEILDKMPDHTLNVGTIMLIFIGTLGLLIWVKVMCAKGDPNQQDDADCRNPKDAHDDADGFSHEIDDFAMNRRLRKDRERRLRNGSGRAARNLFAMAQDHIDNNVHGADGTVRTAPKLSKHKSKTVTFDDTIHEPHSPHSRQYSVSLSITSDEEPMDANSECFTFVPTASSSPDCVITPNTPNSAK